MKKSSIYLGLVLALMFSACQGEPTESTEEKAPVCTYTYNEGTTEFQWTAFKTNAKVGVPGSFNEIEVTSESASDPKTVLESLQFRMKTASVETNNEERNGKIAEHFFKTINTDVISGSVQSLSDNGKAVITVMMNGVSFDIEGDYTLEDRKFSFSSTVDVASWNGMSGIEALNTVCKDLHTGEDGVSKLWSEVDLSFSTILKSDCN